MRLLAEIGLHGLADLGHAGHAADQDHLVDLAWAEPGVLQRRLARPDGALDQVVDQGLQLGAGQLDVEVLGAALVGGDERQGDLGLGRGAELDLGLLGRLLEALQRQFVGAQVDALLLFELVGQVVDDPLVEVLAAQEGVAVGRLDLEDAVADLQDRDVEGAAAQVVDRDGAGLLLLQAVGQGGRRRLVDDAQHLEPGDLAGVLGRLALGIVEVGGHRDHRLGDRLAEEGFGGLLHLLQDEGGDLAGAVVLALGLDPGIAVVGLDDLVGHQALVLLDHRVVVAAADQPLDGEEGILGVGDRLALGRLADQTLAGLGKGDHGWRGPDALGVLDDLRLGTFHHGDAGIRRAKIDADDLAHCIPLVAADRPAASIAVSTAPGSLVGDSKSETYRGIYKHEPRSCKVADIRKP